MAPHPAGRERGLGFSESGFGVSSRDWGAVGIPVETPAPILQPRWASHS